MIANITAVLIQVDNHAGHVWAEALLDARWVHIDPCEAAVDDAWNFDDGPSRYGGFLSHWGTPCIIQWSWMTRWP